MIPSIVRLPPVVMLARLLVAVLTAAALVAPGSLQCLFTGFPPASTRNNCLLLGNQILTYLLDFG